MKRLVSLLILAILTISSFSQELTIKSFQEKPTDLSARTNPRNDLNGNPCALIRIEVLLSDVKFEGNVIGNVEHKVNEYWVYMSEGSKHLKVRHSSYFSFDIVFADYGICSLKGKTTYELLIKAEQGNSNVTSNADSLAQVTQSQDSRAVDLGLSVKWASCNVGASKPEEYGDYFAWGETKTKSKYKYENYKWYKSANYPNFDKYTKYCIESKFGAVDHKTTLDLEDDAAHAKWGGSWRMPTKDEIDELRTKCKWEWISQNGVNGCIVTGPNGNSIYLPATGLRDQYGSSSEGRCGLYWSNSLNETSQAYGILFDSKYTNTGKNERRYGQCVRPVCP